MKWILILTIMGMDGPFINNAPGFDSEAACKDAGATWKEDVRDSRSADRSTLTYSCVPSSIEKKPINP